MKAIVTGGAGFIGSHLVELLIKKKFNVVIYANHLFRASYPAMQKTAISILKFGRSKELDKKLISIKEILKLIPGTN